MIRQTIDQRLLAAQTAIGNARSDAGILAALSIYGYDEAKLDAGQALYDEAQALVNKQKLEYGEQYEATEMVQAAWDEANTAYMRTLKIARVALKGGTKARAAMMLDKQRKRSVSGWLEQATAFYVNLLSSPDLMAAMAVFGYDQAKLETEQALVQAVADASMVQKKETGEAQEATKLRDAKLDELDEWMSDFKAVAQVALEENGQWLEKLGFGAVP
ncbi:MAG: hypothetical protein GY835_16345 [bacterium]|nr:hypothetical protein [bacterium]